MSIHSIPEDNTSVNEQFEIVERLVREIAHIWDERTRADVEAMFRIGDRVRSMIKCDAYVCRSALTMKFGKGLYRKFKQCGWIAERWSDLNIRSDEMERGRGWSYFRDTLPNGDPIEKTRKPVDFFIATEVRHEEGDAYYIKGAGSKEKEITLRVPEDVYEAAIKK